MKKLFILTMFAAMFCCANAVGADKIQFKTIKTHIKTPACDYKLSIDYPMGNSVTDNNIRECINEMLGGSYTGDLNNVNALVNYYAREREKSERGDMTDRDCKEWIIGEIGKYTGKESYIDTSDSIYVVYENSKLLTLCKNSYHIEFGASYFDSEDNYITVRKADGRIFGLDMMLNEKAKSPEFLRLLVNGMKEYFFGDPSTSDKELLQYLDLNDTKELELPKGNKMYITDKYVTFVYGKGEIADAMTFPQSVIPIEKILPYLTATMRELLRPEKNVNVQTMEPKSANNIANSQTLEFAVLTDEEVCFRKLPSTTAPILMFHFENEGSWNYCWAYDANDELTVEYRDKGSIVQVISKQDDWYKVRYYPAHGLGSDVPENEVQYIEGWIRSEYLKTVEPIKLTWDNINTTIEKDCNMESAMKCYVVDDINVPQTLFIQHWFGEGGGICMLYGKMENNHLNIYGSSDDLIVEWSSDNNMRGIAIKKEDGHNVLHYGGNVASDGIEDYDSQDVDIRKCTPQMREQILKAISNKLYSRRYYFNIGNGGKEDIRSFEIKSFKSENSSANDSDSAEQQTIDRIKSFYNNLGEDEKIDVHALIPLYCTRSFAKQMADEYEYDGCEDGQCYAYWWYFPVAASDVSNWAEDDAWCYDGISNIKAIGNGWYQATIKGSGVKTYIVIKYFQMENEGPNAKFNKVTTEHPNITVANPESDNKIHDLVEQQPSFNGNIDTWLAANLKYPPVAAEEGIEGRVIVQFVVGKDGSIFDATVVRGIEESLDREALRVVNSMPKWIPAKQNGEAVSCKYTFPVVFRLQ